MKGGGRKVPKKTGFYFYFALHELNN